MQGATIRPYVGLTDRINTIVARAFEIDAHEIEPTFKGPQRYRRYVVPRQVSMWLTREVGGMKSAKLGQYSFPHIGRLYGGRDHSTVMHGISMVNNRRDNDPDFRAMTDRLRDDVLATIARPAPIELPEAVQDVVGFPCEAFGGFV